MNASEKIAGFVDALTALALAGVDHDTVTIAVTSDAVVIDADLTQAQAWAIARAAYPKKRPTTEADHVRGRALAVITVGRLRVIARGQRKARAAS